MARSPSTDGAPKRKQAARPQGPRKLFIILKPGTDVAAARDMIVATTFNGRTMVDLMSKTGEAVPFLLYNIEVEKRNTSGAGADASGVSTDAE